MASHQTPFENRHTYALRVAEVGVCTRPDQQGPVRSVAASLQRFTGNPSPLVSGTPWWDTSGALTL